MNKKSILLFSFVLLHMICVNAQEHMTIMGIPINGSISSFCNKLESKGFKKDADIQNAKCYKGKFFDENSDIQVEYDSETKIVHSVTVFIVKQHLLSALSIQKEMIASLKDKYGDQIKEEIVNPKLNQSNYYVFNGLDLIGLIRTFVISSANETMFSITYTDVENYLKTEERKVKDL